jgi:hypothetical protein
MNLNPPANSNGFQIEPINTHDPSPADPSANTNPPKLTEPFPTNEKPTKVSSEQQKPQPLPQEVPETRVEKKEVLNDMTLDQVLKFNTLSVDFGNVFPGQIVEEPIIILNNLTNTKVPFKIKVNCLTKEFDELDEYVFSMRRFNQNDDYNYNDTFLILLAQKAISYYRLAIKTPMYKGEAEVLGNIEISSAECPAKTIVIPIRARIIPPNIKCEKLIHIKSLNMSLIKLFMKTPKRQDFRISLKNQSKIGCVCEPLILKNDSTANFIDFNFYPAQITLNSQISTHFMMSVKCSLAESEIVNKEVRAVLVVRVRNSCVLFAYPMIIIIGDGKGGESIN